jgi:hypothetical protein
MRAEQWEPVAGICGPCDGIAFSYSRPRAAELVLTFAGTARDPTRDLILQFKQVVILSSEDEAPGGFVAAPAVDSLPKLGRGLHPSWTFPLLKIIDSEALKRYQLMRAPNSPLAHFFIISMDNLVHVIASPKVGAVWSSPNRTGASA